MKKLAIAFCSLCLLLSALPTQSAPNPSVLPPTARPYGKSYTEWSIEWHKWILKLPAAGHPLVDLTGAQCDAGQSGPVWFLAREDYLSFTTGFPTVFIERNCTVPVGKAIYIPQANTFWAAPEDSAYLDMVGYLPGLDLVERLTAATHYVLDHTQNLSITVDGVPVRNLANYRVVTPALSLDFPADSFGVTPPMYYAIGTHSPIVAGGYGVILAPPSVGPHEIRIHIEFLYENDPLFGLNLLYVADLVYHINVVN